MKRSFVFLIPLALGVLGVTSGCSSDDDGTAPASLERDILPKKVAEAFCENVTDCCTEAGVDQDMDTCLENAEQSFEALLAASDTTNTKYDGTRGNDCVAAFKSQTPKCGKLTDADIATFASSCGALFVGTLAAGETCSSSSECAGKLSTCKKESADDATGKCASLAKRAHAKSGDDCAVTCADATCTYDPLDNDAVTAGCYASDKLWCNDGTCEAIGDVGDACDAYGCKAGLFCADGACAPQRKAGQPCDPAVFNACAEGTLCNADREECEKQHANGAVCELDSDCLSATCRNGVCAINNASEEVCSGLELN